MEVYIHLKQPRYKEKSNFVATAYFRDGEAANAPTTAKYRVDCLTTRKELEDWTTLTPGASIDISLVPNTNKIQDDCNAYEVKQLTVAADPDGTSEVRESVTYHIENIRRVS